VFVGAVLAVAAILIAELLNRCVRTPVDIENYLGLPVLAELGKTERRPWFGNPYKRKTVPAGEI
ncbi:MAG: hypothetical protein ACRCU9_11625, partial [Iodobacter sp.]